MAHFALLAVYQDGRNHCIFSQQTFVYLNASGLFFSIRTELIIRSTLLSLVLVRSDAAQDPIARLTGFSAENIRFAAVIVFLHGKQDPRNPKI